MTCRYNVYWIFFVALGAALLLLRAGAASIMILAFCRSGRRT